MNPSLASDLTSVMIETMTGSGIIYCPSVNTFDRGTDTVIELDRNLLPQRGGFMMWTSCAAALDGCIYFIQSYARRVMKLDPNNMVMQSSVSEMTWEVGFVSTLEQ